jgi:hypothetical protein
LTPRGTLAAIGAVVALVAGVAIWYFGLRDRGASAPAPAGATAERRVVIAPKLPGVMLVNDARDAHIGPATPLFAECVLSNPTAGAIVVTTTGLSPEVRDVNEATVPVTWERVSDTPATIAPGGSISVRWVASTRVPAGDYEVFAAGEASVAAVGVARVQVDAARLVVRADTDADEDEAAAIRLLAWRGQSADALARIDAALAATPDALVMQLWRGDLLQELGRRDEAVAQFNQLAAAIDVRQRARANARAELPFWLAARIENR